MSGIFCLFPQTTPVIINSIKIRKHKKKLKALSGSSPIFALSNYTTFDQTQTGATVPSSLKKNWLHIRSVEHCGACFSGIVQYVSTN
jgi:hypothetical protein